MPFRIWRIGRIMVGNAHIHTMTNMTSHAQRILLRYPVHATISPMRIIAREAKPTGAKKFPAAGRFVSWDIVSRQVRASAQNIGVAHTNTMVKSTLERKTKERRV